MKKTLTVMTSGIAVIFALASLVLVPEANATQDALAADEVDKIVNEVLEDGDTVVATADGEEEEEEEDGEPLMWPVYLSFGAIGVTLLLIIILNLTSKNR